MRGGEGQGGGEGAGRKGKGGREVREADMTERDTCSSFCRPPHAVRSPSLSSALMVKNGKERVHIIQSMQTAETAKLGKKGESYWETG